MPSTAESSPSSADPGGQSRWLKAARVLLVALAVVAAGVAWFKVSDRVYGAIARVEVATFGGGRLVFDVDLDRGAPAEELLARVRKTIASRLENVTGHTVVVHGEGSRLFADLPRRAWAQLLRVKPRLDGLQQLFVTAKLEFAIVDDADTTLARLSGLPSGIAVDWDRYEGANRAIVTAPYLTSNDWEALRAFGRDRAPAGRVLSVSLNPDGTGKYRTYLLHERAALTGDDVADARVAFDSGENPRPYVGVTFNEPGARLFESLTANNVFRRLAIVFDGRVDSAPIIQSAIPGGYCAIHLGGSKPIAEVLKEAKDLSLLLRAGALAAPVHLVSVEPLGPRR